MVRNIYFTLLLFFIAGSTAFAQTGEIKGKVSDDSGELVPFASVGAYLNGVQAQATQTDFDGAYTLKPLQPGKYTLKISCVGYSSLEVQNVTVSTDKISFQNVKISKGIQLAGIQIELDKVIDPGTPSSQVTKTREEIQQAPLKDVTSVAATSGGVFQKEEGDGLNVRGSRSDATTYYVDGIKKTGSLGVGQNSVEQITVIVGGTPARYGDFTGGAIIVTTRGPSQKFNAGVEVTTSQFFDDYDNNLFSAYASGPVFSRTDSVSGKQPVLGFFIGAEYQSDKDASPSGIGTYKVKDDILDEIRQEPLIKSPNTAGFIQKINYITLNDMEKIKAHQNVKGTAYRVNGKFDLRPSKNIDISIGGNYEHTKNNPWIQFYTLFNYDQHSVVTADNWSGFVKFTQSFPTNNSEKSASKIKNVYYSLQADYSSNNSLDQNEKHKDNYFDYGYIGKFTTYQAPFYADAPVVINGVNDTLPSLFGYFDTLVVYDPSDLNPYTANYTNQYFDLAPGAAGYYQSLFQIQNNGALINGDNRANLNVYGLWSSTGRIRNFYGKTNADQFRFTAQGSADIGNHNIVVGMEYEQRNERSWSLSPSSLWGAMRAYSNLSVPGNLDLAHPQIAFDANGDTVINYDYLYIQQLNYDSSETRGFYENVRDLLGIAYNKRIDLDSYDPSTFSLDLFAPAELPVGYFGYDAYGNKYNSDFSVSTIDKFFNDVNEDNAYTYLIPSFQPVYTAGYIEDKFTFNDLIFNIGLRVDRFDANQPAIKDPYSIYTTYTASTDQAKNLASSAGQFIPDNIGSDYVVYVNDINTPTRIVGYRNPENNKWYTSSGAESSDLDFLTTGSGNITGTIQPFVTDVQAAKDKRPTSAAFKDYEAQVNFAPRLAFSFPISDDAYFSAHYDVLNQRPQNEGLLRFNPFAYQNLANGVTANIANSNLTPEKTIDYEVTFKQRLNKTAALSLSAFYKELRDNVQIINVTYAYPIDYTTYGNIDFGTVKGLTIGYDMRRTGNVRMNANYTLQFAEGTGSNEFTSAGALAQQGQANLRNIKPLDFDQRHTLVASFDYRYESGKDYNGPVVGKNKKQILSNAGLNLVFKAGSGTPYTRKANITPSAETGNIANSRNVVAGDINGSRLPWQFNVDAKIDKSFSLNLGKDKEGNGGREAFVNVYIQVLNVFDAERITTVYAATGDAKDDGYLSDATAQNNINSQLDAQAYRDLYTVSLLNPASSHFSLPRRIRLGIQFNF